MMGPLRRLARDQRGSYVAEFAVVLPGALILVLGMGDLAYQGYVQTVLTGAVQKAGRDSTLQDNFSKAADVDQKVKDAILALSPNATFQPSKRKNYDTYAQIGPEPFTDVNGNKTYDLGECFSDINGNGVWDADGGSTGQGGANDVTLYTVTVSIPRLFPVARLVGWGSAITLSATTLLKNQPYATQSVTSAAKCPGS